MKPSRFTEEQIISILRVLEGGAKTARMLLKHGSSVRSSTILRTRLVLRIADLMDFVNYRAWRQRLRAHLPSANLAYLDTLSRWSLLPMKRHTDLLDDAFRKGRRAITAL